MTLIRVEPHEATDSVYVTRHVKWEKLSLSTLGNRSLTFCRFCFDTYLNWINI